MDETTLKLIPQPSGIAQFTERDAELLTPPENPESNFSIPKLIGMARRKKVIVMGLSFGLALFLGLKSYREDTFYESSFQILVQPVTQKQKLTNLTGDKTESSDTSKEFDYTTQIEVLLSPKNLEPVVKEINTKFPDVTVEYLNQNLAVYRLGETKVIEVKLKDENPEKVKYILQKVAKGYLKYSYEEQRASLRQGIEFVNDQLPVFRKRVNAIQDQLQALRQRYNFVDPESYSADLYKQLSDLGQQRQTLRNDIDTMTLRYKTLEKQSGALVAINQSPSYKEFLTQFQALDRQIVIELARFGENSPTIKQLRQQQDNLIPLLQAEAQRTLKNQMASLWNDLQISIAREQSVGKRQREVERKYQQMPAVSRVYADLLRELKAATESLERFMSTREGLEIEAAQNQIPWQLVRPPHEPTMLPKGSFAKGVATGFMAGAVLALAIAFILERIEGAFYIVSDLRQVTRLPLLGTIPFRKDLKSAGPDAHIVDWRPLLEKQLTESAQDSIEEYVNEALAAMNAPNSEDDTMPEDEDFPAPVPMGSTYNFLEAFRSLHTYIGRVRENPHRWTLAISSAMPGEGRTIVAMHLAQAAAAMNRRVLLVDAHFLSGENSTSEFLGMSPRPGLGDFLMGQSPLRQVIRPLHWENNLFFISAGASPPDPTRALASPRMQELMRRVKESFDIVIYDTPPLMGLADLGILATHTDGVLFVVKFRKWGASTALANALERLKVAKIPVVGVVANSVKEYSLTWFLRSR
ncbi:MAG TPA: AAA family ATPase [Stenomitos sp.]